jgi:hypothetical protein
MNLDSKLQNKDIFKLQKHVICATLVLPIKTGSITRNMGHFAPALVVSG